MKITGPVEMSVQGARFTGGTRADGFWYQARSPVIHPLRQPQPDAFVFPSLTIVFIIEIGTTHYFFDFVFGIISFLLLSIKNVIIFSNPLILYVIYCF